MPRDLFTLAVFETPLEAALVQGQLADAGIESVLADAEIVTAAWHLSNAVGGVKIRVRSEDVQRARALLNAEKETDFDSTTDTVGELPYEAEDEAERMADDFATRSLTAALVAFLFAPFQVYSIWLLVRYATVAQSASRRGRRSAMMALVLDVLAVLVYGVILYLIVRG